MPNQQQHCLPYHISIHAPHEGERLNLPAGVYANGEFQSTLPTRGSDFFSLLIQAPSP